uniref:CSON014269 protein n=1 Tax=Culicoides sonorensis TaxID=179676 RepID=A0A336MFU1_CULSO
MSTPTQPTPPNGPPPVPPTKPVLSSPGAYMANFSTTTGTPTAGIHSSNKTHEKPAIAARPIPPPTLPKYSSSFTKADAPPIPGAKIDRLEREKEGIGGSYRLTSLDRLAARQRILEQNNGLGTVQLNANNELSNNGTIPNKTNGHHRNINETNGGNIVVSSSSSISASIISSTTISTTTSLNQNNGFNNHGNNGLGAVGNGTFSSGLQSKREMFFKNESIQSPSGPPPVPPTNNANNHTTPSNAPQLVQIKTTNTSSTTITGTNNTFITNEKYSSAMNHHHNNHANSHLNNDNKLAALNNMSTFNKQEAKGNGHMENGHDSNKIASERHEKEKPVIKAKPKELDGYVGFANLPNQVYRKAVKKGFEFTLMVVGESGLGKSTLINSMFLTDIYNPDVHPGPSFRVKKTVEVETTKVVLKENGVNLTLTVVDTPGFGDAVDNSNCWTPVIDFVESKYEEYLTAESRVHRKAMSDSRVHCCLYFIAPSGHGLKPLDVEFMQRVCDKVNIIPVIAKADTMTPEEVTQFKKQILNEIAQHKIKIYDFPEPLDDEEEAKVMRQLRQRVPFAVVGANTVIEVEGGKKVRGRRYPWGVAEVENLEHCDFIALRNMVIRTHLQDLKEVTNNVHYENYRCRKLAGLGADGKGKSSNKNPLAQMEEEKREHEAKMKKMEAEMEQVFEMKVKEKKQKLKDSEVELTRRHEERKKALELQIRELEERKKAFEQERIEWEQANGVTLEELRRKSLEANSKETMDNGGESKHRRGFGSLLRRHTSFGAPDSTNHSHQPHTQKSFDNL